MTKGKKLVRVGSLLNQLANYITLACFGINFISVIKAIANSPDFSFVDVIFQVPTILTLLFTILSIIFSAKAFKYGSSDSNENLIYKNAISGAVYALISGFFAIFGASVILVTIESLAVLLLYPALLLQNLTLVGAILMIIGGKKTASALKTQQTPPSTENQ